MRVTYTTPNGRVQFEAEVSTAKEAFDFLATVQEVFEVGRCGLCKGAAIHCDVREFDKNVYYKLVCSACGAQLDVGQKKDQKNLFLKRRSDAREALPNGGWYHYQPGDREAA